MADIDQKKHGFQLSGSVQVILDHLSPFFLLRLGNLCVSVSRQIHQIERLICVSRLPSAGHHVKINGLGLSGR